MWCVCSGYKLTGEVTWLVNGTELSRKPSAQTTKGWDVSFSNQGWDKHGRDDITMIPANKHKITSQGVKPPFFIYFFPHLTRTFFDCVAGQIMAVMTITYWGFRRGFQGLADPSASTHTHTSSPALTLLSSFDLLWIIHCLSTNVKRVLCFSQTVWTFLGQHNCTRSRVYAWVAFSLCLVCVCVCSVLSLGNMEEGEEEREVKMSLDAWCSLWYVES